MKSLGSQLVSSFIYRWSGFSAIEVNARQGLLIFLISPRQNKQIATKQKTTKLTKHTYETKKQKTQDIGFLSNIEATAQS